MLCFTGPSPNRVLPKYGNINKYGCGASGILGTLSETARSLFGKAEAFQVRMKLKEVTN